MEECRRRDHYGKGCRSEPEVGVVVPLEGQIRNSRSHERFDLEKMRKAGKIQSRLFYDPQDFDSAIVHLQILKRSINRMLSTDSPDYVAAMTELAILDNRVEAEGYGKKKNTESEIETKKASIDGIKSPTEVEASRIKLAEQEERRRFSTHREGWEFLRGSQFGRSGGFEDMTSLSPRHFTHCTRHQLSHHAVIASSLQIFSIEVTEIKEALKLEWPLYVYGVVAARDTVDHNRNILFGRKRDQCQMLAREDSCLQLTGPSRAIVSMDPVCFEIELKVKGKTEHEDRVLIRRVFLHDRDFSRVFTPLLENHFCTMKLRFELLEQTVQATVVSVRADEGSSWQFQYGVRVFCTVPRRKKMMLPHQQVVLLDSKDTAMPAGGSDGCLPLLRNVVSVDVQRLLKVDMQAYSPSGAVSLEDHAYFTPKVCGISQAVCHIGNSRVEISIAWSPLVGDKGNNGIS